MNTHIDVFLYDGRLKSVKRQPLCMRGGELLELKDSAGNVICFYMDADNLTQLRHALGGEHDRVHPGRVGHDTGVLASR